MVAATSQARSPAAEKSVATKIFFVSLLALAGFMMVFVSNQRAWRCAARGRIQVRDPRRNCRFLTTTRKPFGAIHDERGVAWDRSRAGPEPGVSRARPDRPAGRFHAPTARGGRSL